MKKLLLPLLLLISSYAMGQQDITFMVDMNGFTVDPAGVHLGANWDGWSGAIVMEDTDGDGVYEVTQQLNPMLGEFKFINGAEWENLDSLVGQSCVMDFGGFVNRILTVESDPITVCYTYGSCESCLLTGLNNFVFDNSFFSIQPTLAFDHVTLTFNTTNNDDKEITIINTDGRVVYSKTLTGDIAIHNIDVKGLVNGIYFIQIQSGKTLGTQKIVVNK